MTRRTEGGRFGSQSIIGGDPARAPRFAGRREIVPARHCKFTYGYFGFQFPTFHGLSELFLEPMGSYDRGA